MNIKKGIKDLIEILVIALIISFIITKVLFMSCEVVGSSMRPTLYDGDRGFSSIVSKNNIHRFDIVVIDHEESDNEKLLVKRVIGLPGETIEYIDNVLYINNVKYEENFIHDTSTNDFKVTLNDDEYYCLGDNRSVSRDSRSYGPFKIDSIKSVHIFVFFPFNHIGLKKWTIFNGIQAIWPKLINKYKKI